jgi:hypothetical protein
MYREGGALKSDQYWPKPWLWTGLVPHYGPVWTTMIGTPHELAAAFLEYERIGVTEFIFPVGPNWTQSISSAGDSTTYKPQKGTKGTKIEENIVPFVPFCGK